MENRRSACDGSYTTEQQCAEACIAGGYVFYVWDPDAECALIGGWWVCVRLDQANCCQCSRASGDPETDCYEGGFDPFACEEILVKDGLEDWDQCEFHELARCLEDDTCVPLAEACCFPDGSCEDLDPVECETQGGTPQGPGTGCVNMTIACCLPDGSCMDVDPLCCDDVGGHLSPIGEPHCLGDWNGNDIDDACEEPPPFECPPDTIFAQPAHGPYDPWAKVLSDRAAGTHHYDNFLIPLSPDICDIHWWGFHAYEDPPGTWIECFEDPATFEISFTDDGGGPGCDYTVTVFGVPTGVFYDGIELWAYETNLEPCCPITSGTVSIVGAGPEDPCWFLWLSGRAIVDGKKDILSGNTEGELLLYRNVGSDDAPVFADPLPIRSAGMPIDLAGMPRSRPFVCDWTDDGLLDVLVGVQEDGTQSGNVHLYQGVSDPGLLNLGPEELIHTNGVIEVPGWSVPSFVRWDGDDLKDLVVGEGGMGLAGKVRIYLNEGTLSNPQFSNYFYAQSSGSDLAVLTQGCLGAFPRVVYWDADGWKDLIVGQADGTVMLFLNTNGDADPRFDGGRFLEVGDPGSTVPIDVGIRATPTVVDWNGDGKKDLVVGALEDGGDKARGVEVRDRDEGKVHIFINEGTDTEPDFRSEQFAQMADGTDLSVPSGRSSPDIGDLAGDGDALCWGTDDIVVWEQPFDLSLCLTGEPQACCLPDGSCINASPEVCAMSDGVLQGAGTMCTELEGCCLDDGTCLDLDPLCCDDMGQMPQGAGTACVDMTIACCLPDGDCADVDPLCCDDLGGMPMGMESHCSTTECSPLKWIQLPDETENGIDICLGQIDNPMHILADDFECTHWGPITDVHLWGSWRDDVVGEITWMQLSIHSDDPVGLGGSDPANEFSKPDVELWQREFLPGEFSMMLHTDVYPGEWWWDPYTGELIEHGDTQVWRVDIDINVDEAFVQEGSSVDPLIYWLAIRARTADGEFGWKTRRWPHHYQDDAVWDWGSELPRFWNELRYPPGHPYHGLEDDSIDLAFALTTPKIEWVSKWSQLPHDGGDGFDAASDLCWPEPLPPPVEVNKVVADDFVSDGRSIEALVWWGSYLDERYSPLYEPVEPYVLDGWLIGFHHTDPDAPCPPEPVPADVPTVLGVYYAPVDAVQISGLFMADCFGHSVFLYEVDLNQCCLLCSETDPRPEANPSVPARHGRFLETAGLGYWLDIQAVVGVTWSPPACEYDDRVLTGHLPSDITSNGHFWGWHTSPGPEDGDPLEEACTGKITDFTPYPPDCWHYGEWVKQPWLCDEMPPFPPVHMAFQLLTSESLPTCYCRDVNCDGAIDALDLGVIKNPANWLLTVPPANPLADVNRDGSVDALDLGAVKNPTYWLTGPHPGGCTCSNYTPDYTIDCPME